PPLVDGAFIIIAWVAVKLFIEYLHTEGYVAFEIPRAFSLGIIVVIFAVAYGFAVRQERKPSSSHVPRAPSPSGSRLASAWRSLGGLCSAWRGWRATRSPSAG